jgi:hypothetical protein
MVQQQQQQQQQTPMRDAEEYSAMSFSPQPSRGSPASVRWGARN